MNDEQRLRRLLQAIAQVPEQVIDCSTCLDRVPVLVDCELAGGALPSDTPILRQHLLDCPDCDEEYQALRDLAAREASGTLPSREALLRTLHARSRDSGDRS